MSDKDNQKNNEEFDDELEGVSEFKIPRYKKFLMKYFPGLFLRLFGKEIGLDNKKIGHAYKLFEDAEIHIQPLSGGSRGFILTLDNKLTLWFYQDGDHFKFDGIEMGEYDDGDVTVFDN
jgi:hypothetical protein